MFSGLGVDAQLEDWCIADEQTPDDELQRAMVWACENGADCSKIEANQPCFEPNTVKDHASFAFNSYFQRMKAKGATCYFNSAAYVTDLDPSKYINILCTHNIFYLYILQVRYIQLNY
ncbi:putative glucan endo-1,3-beta-D-glucosidase [Helianthus debilis subsp. tardiflorus]